MFKKSFTYLSEIFHLFGKDRKKIPMLFIIFLSASLLDLLSIGLIGPYVSLAFDPSISNELINELFHSFNLSNDRGNLIVILGFVLITLFIIKLFFAILVNFMIVKFGRDQQIQMRTNLMRSYQSLKYLDFTKRNSSEYIYTISTLVTQYTNQVVIPLLKTISDGLVSIVIVSFLAWSSPLVMLFLFLMMGIVIVVYDAVFRNKIKVYGVEANKAGALMVKSINEGIGGLKEIRILGKQQFFYKKMESSTIKNDSLIAKLNVISSIPRYIFELVMISFVVLLIIGAILFDQNLQSLLPTLAMFGVASLRLVPSANGLSNSLIAIRFARDAVSRLYKDSLNFQKTHTIGCLYESEEFEEFKIENATFRYENTDIDILKNISFTVKKGESIGLVGPSGSGKTTFLNIILGLIPLNQGEVIVNNLALSDVNSQWYKQVAYLPQQTFLIDDSIRCNIALGEMDKDIDDDKIYNVIKKSSLHDFIKSLSGGLDTVLGEGGVKISGGQRQRIALARAFYFDRDVLVMDESTSSLDHKTESEIMSQVKELHGKKTMIVVTHRLSTVQHCDRIYHLENGRLTQIDNSN